MESSRPGILIMGAGAVGSVFGALLAENGHNVTLVGRDWHLMAIAEKGLHVDGIWGEHHVKDIRLLTDVRGTKEKFDVCLLTVKTYDTKSAVKEITPILKPDSVVVSLQNGLGNFEIISKAIGIERTVAGRIIFGAEIPSPGCARVTVSAEPVMLGSMSRNPPEALVRKISELAEILNRAGIESESTSRIEAYLWGKMFYNCALNPLGALLDVEYGVLMDNPHTRAIMNSIIREAFQVAQTKGADIFWKEVDEYLDLFYSKLVPLTYHHRASMLRDIKRGRLTEIEAMNGLIAEYGDRLGIATPINRLLTRMILFKTGLSFP